MSKRIGWKAAGSDRKIASLRYRVEAPVRSLEALGHKVEIFDRDAIDSYDTVVFAKAYSADDRKLAASVRSRGGRVVFDLCDNHFHNPYDLPKYRQAREDLLDMLSMSQAVICATPTLARVVREEAPWAAEPVVIGDPVEKVPQAAASLPPFGGLRLLWFGSHGSPNAPSGMPDILLIAEHLEAISRDHPLELVVCSNDRDKFERLIAPLPFATRYIDWSLDGFPGVLASADGVVIPISRNPFTACKTHNRLTTALYAGASVIADRIEDYEAFAPFCTLDDWPGGLRALIERPAAERERALGARDYIDGRWTAEALAPKWEAALGLNPLSVAEAAPVLAKPIVDRPQETLKPTPVRPAVDPVAVRCQGALDGRGEGAVTGWVRIPSDPGRRLTVVLESEGREVARARADLQRPDLARVGMNDCACGFSLPAPSAAAGALFEVVVEETGWRFDEPPFGLRGDDADLRLSFRPEAAATRPRGGPAMGADSRVQRHLAPADARAAKDIQEQVLAELENLAALAAQARDVAARLLLAAGDDASLARRVLSVLAGKPRPGAARPGPRRGDPEDRPPVHLN